MRELTILSGAGINMAIADCCEEAGALADFTYQSISESVYDELNPAFQALFARDSFDTILGGLITINLALTKMHVDMQRFGTRPEALEELYSTTVLQQATADALELIGERLRVQVDELVGTVEAFDATVEYLYGSFDSINYFTVNFDSIFDHILLGRRFKRSPSTTDFWSRRGSFRSDYDRKCKIFHLHGDLRYRPHKVMPNSPPAESLWPIVVVGDGEVKRGIIASHEALQFYNRRLRQLKEYALRRNDDHILLVVGFGFRDEDRHIVTEVRAAITGGAFSRIVVFSRSNGLRDVAGVEHVHPDQTSFTDLLQQL